MEFPGLTKPAATRRPEVPPAPEGDGPHREAGFFKHLQTVVAEESTPDGGAVQPDSTEAQKHVPTNHVIQFAESALSSLSGAAAQAEILPGSGTGVDGAGVQVGVSPDGRTASPAASTAAPGITAEPPPPAQGAGDAPRQGTRSVAPEVTAAASPAEEGALRADTPPTAPRPQLESGEKTAPTARAPVENAMPAGMGLAVIRNAEEHGQRRDRSSGTAPAPTASVSTTPVIGAAAPAAPTGLPDRAPSERRPEPEKRHASADLRIALPEARPAVPSGAGLAPATDAVSADIQPRVTVSPASLSAGGIVTSSEPGLVSAASGTAAPDLRDSFTTSKAHGGAEIARAVAPQLVSAIGNHGGGNSIQILLDPPELGRVEIALELGEHGLRASLVAERGATGEMMRRHGDILLQHLQNAGFAEVDLRFGQRQETLGGRPSPATTRGHSGPDGPANAAGATHFIQAKASTSEGLDLRF